MATAPKKFAAKTAAPAPVSVIAASPSVIVEQVSEAGKTAVESVTANVATVQETVRKAAEQGIEQSRAAYERAKNAAEDANGTIEASFANASKGFSEISAKAFDALRANSEAVFELMKALTTVKSPSEAFNLHAEHARKQFDAVSAQTKEISALTQKLASESVAPLKAGFDKAMQAKH